MTNDPPRHDGHPEAQQRPPGGVQIYDRPWRADLAKRMPALLGGALVLLALGVAVVFWLV